MATYQSRDDIVTAYKNLLRLEQSLHKTLAEADIEPDWEQVNSLVSKQNEIMSEIDNRPELDPFSQAEESEQTRRVLEQFSSLRQQNQEQLQTLIQETKRQFKSLDQAEKLMKHYLQGEKRFGPSMSRRFEQEI